MAYDLSYEYDQRGNRLRKIDAVAEQETEYHYDVDDPEAACALEYPAWHNRLLSYDVYDTSQEPMEHLREVRYTYYKTGQVSNITIKDDAGDPNAVDWYYDLSLTYWRHGPLRYALWGRWMNDPNDHPIDESYESLSAREFRFDTPRGRYMMVDLDTNGSDVPTNWTAAGPMKWTDYEGDTPYGDFDVATNSPWATTATTNYFGLSGHQTLDPNENPAETRYWHEDLIGSTMLTTDETGGAGVPPADLAYTAFGERLTTGGIPGGEAPAGASRYQYAGAYGYESDLLSLQGANSNLPPITLQHLGHRWYQPGLGRFVQRDPIGIEGGWNVFAYVDNAPAIFIDPDGDTTVLAGTLPFAGGAAVADGPLPFGDVLALGALAVAACVDIWIEKEHDKNKSKGKRDKHEKGKKRTKQKHNDKKRNKPDWSWGRGLSCFVGRTLVWTSAGLQEIGAITVQTDVITDATIQLGACAKPIRIWRSSANSLVCIELPSETIVCTPEHPFALSTGGWAAAGALRAGDDLVTVSGGTVSIVTVNYVENECSTAVYNLTVGQSETYYVGITGILVHNKIIH